MSLNRAEATAEIAAPADACFAAITDYKTFPTWQAAVKAVEVLERYPDGLAAIVEFSIDAKLRDIHYRLRYHYQRPERLWCEFLEGDVAAIESDYHFAPGPQGTTVATYRVGLDLGFPVPGPIMRRIAKALIQGSVNDLKDEAERRMAATDA